MNKFQPHINVDYPPNNRVIFEEWFSVNYTGCNTERELLPIFPTSFHVNNGYGEKKQELQDYCDTLDESKKYFIICQYDDGCMVDWKGKDVLEFNMSKTNGVMLPLICQPQPYNFSTHKKFFASFIGSKTNSIRNKLEYINEKEDCYFSWDNHFIQDYCRIINESMFCLCPRGYGANSFRIGESIQYGAIPVYISDEFILPFNINFEDFGVLIKAEDAAKTHEILHSIPYETIYEKQKRLPEIYQRYYTYNGCMNEIIKCLESENAPTS